MFSVLHCLSYFQHSRVVDDDYDKKNVPTNPVLTVQTLSSMKKGTKGRHASAAGLKLVVVV
jgi:hypothetical protein